MDVLLLLVSVVAAVDAVAHTRDRRRDGGRIPSASFCLKYLFSLRFTSQASVHDCVITLDAVGEATVFQVLTRDERERDETER